MGGLNLKGGLGKLTNPKTKEKQVYLLSHKEQKRRRKKKKKKKKRRKKQRQQPWTPHLLVNQKLHLTSLKK
jgi:5'-3' exonuclease